MPSHLVVDGRESMRITPTDKMKWAIIDTEKSKRGARQEVIQ